MMKAALIIMWFNSDANVQQTTDIYDHEHGPCVHVTDNHASGNNLTELRRISSERYGE